jgi:hypothetical protein
MQPAEGPSGHIRLTSHPGSRGPVRFPVRWDAATPEERGPVIATVNSKSNRNAIGAHGGSYSIYRALAISSGAMHPQARPDLQDTSPVCEIGPHPQWGEAGKIVSLDPWGHRIALDFADLLAEGIDIRPSIAITKARLTLPEIQVAIASRRLAVDGEIVHEAGDVSVTKIALDPVWWLPGVAERFGVEEGSLRRCLFEQTGGMYPELVTRPDLSVFLPPIGGMTLYIVGNPAFLGDPRRRSPAGSMTNATDRTCSDPTSAPAGPISPTASRKRRARPRRAASASSSTTARKGERSAK